MDERVAQGVGGGVLHDVDAREVWRDRELIMVTFSYRFKDTADRRSRQAFMNDFVEGREKDTGMTSRRVRLGGKPVTFIPGNSSADGPQTLLNFLYAGEDFMLQFSGLDRKAMERVGGTILGQLR